MHHYFTKQFDLVLKLKVELGSFLGQGLMKVPLFDYEPRTPFTEISNTFSLYSDMQNMEHLMDENALLSWAHVTLQRHNQTQT